MILIVGSTKDDILYFESKMRNKKPETILTDSFHLITGNIFNQKAGLLYNVHSSYLSTLVVHEVIKKYHVILVINVGYASSYTETIKNGEVVLIRQTYFGDVNFTKMQHTMLGQIPSQPQGFASDGYVNQLFARALDNTLKSRYTSGTLVSINKVPEAKSDLREISFENTVLGRTDNILVDSDGAGCALAAHLNNVPFVCIKVCERAIDSRLTVTHYLKVLEKYADVGRAFTSLIGEI
ncbi:MAG: hypothetical protein J6X03_00300, partial [Bacilli bacterium]|nr:hypothetical protein [Bacilli bacterium]